MTTMPGNTAPETPVSALVRHPANGETELYLVRHGQTNANLTRRLVGMTDVPLDALGEQQALLVGERFRAIDIDAIVTSPLHRARRTAEAIGAVTGIQPQPVPGLVEIDFGRAEGLTIEQILEQFPEMEGRLADIHDAELGWPGGETRRGFHERVMTAFLAILERFVGKSVAVVCHGGVISSFIAQLFDVTAANFLEHSVANCSITHLLVTANETRIHCLNDVVHLDDVLTDAWVLAPISEFQHNKGHDKR